MWTELESTSMREAVDSSECSTSGGGGARFWEGMLVCLTMKGNHGSYVYRDIDRVEIRERQLYIPPPRFETVPSLLLLRTTSCLSWSAVCGVLVLLSLSLNISSESKLTREFV